MNWKALVAGIIAIAVLGLIAQVGFLLTATWLAVKKNEGLINPENLQMLNYAAGFAFAIMALTPSGYLTAKIAKSKVILHCALVGAIATILSLITSMGIEHATNKGIIFLVFGTGLTICGGLIWTWFDKSSSDA